MRNYIMVILFTLLTSIIMNTGNPVKADVSVELPEPTTSQETNLSTLGLITEVETDPLASKAEISTTVKSTTEVISVPTTVTPAITNYTVTHVVSSASEYNEIAHSLSYQDIYQFRKMVYAHNSSSLFGNLVSKNTGDVLSITDGTGTHNYQIISKQILKKVSPTTLKNETTGAEYEMIDIVNALYSHDLTLETCYGYGATDYRLVLFANQI